jgi:TonB family protein
VWIVHNAQNVQRAVDAMAVSMANVGRLCALAMVAGPAALRAQAIGGIVRDQAGHALWAVGVSIPADSGKPLAHQDTQRDGTFTLLVPRAGTYRLRFSVAVGVSLESDTIRVGADDFVQREFRVPVPPDAVYYEFQVQKPAVPAPGNTGPLYPQELKAQGVEGGVLAQFIVDTTGRVRPGSFHVLRLTHSEFAAAVAAALPRMRFIPAERDGRKVPQLAQQPFQFELR